MSKTLFMGTTAIPPEKTAGEIIGVLALAGARQITQEYDPYGHIVGVSFTLERGEMKFSYRLPVRTEPILKILSGRRDALEQAKRTAWRTVYRWVLAQVAMIETGMVSTEEVFLPYMLMAGEDGQPVSAYDRFLADVQKQLGAPAPEDG